MTADGKDPHQSERTELSDSDVAALRDELDERKHRKWAYDKVSRSAKWISILVLGVVAFADAAARLWHGVQTWFKH